MQSTQQITPHLVLTIDLPSQARCSLSKTLSGLKTGQALSVDVQQQDSSIPGHIGDLPMLMSWHKTPRRRFQRRSVAEPISDGRDRYKRCGPIR